MKIKTIGLFILFATVLWFERADGDVLITRLLALPKNTIIESEDLKKLGIGSMACEVKSADLDSINEFYQFQYGNREPFVTYRMNLHDFKMILRQSENIKFTYPQMTLKYQKLKILEPYYEMMDQDPKKIQNVCEMLGKIISHTYGEVEDGSGYSILVDTVICEGSNCKVISLKDTVSINNYGDTTLVIQNPEKLVPNTKYLTYYLENRNAESYQIRMHSILSDGNNTEYNIIYKYKRLNAYYVLDTIEARVKNENSDTFRLQNVINFINYKII